MSATAYATNLSDTAAGMIRALVPMKRNTFEVVVDGEVLGTITPTKGGYELLMGTRRSQHASDDDAFAQAKRNWEGGWGEMYRFQRDVLDAETNALTPALRPLWKRVQWARTELARQEISNTRSPDALANAHAQVVAAETAFAAAERNLAEAA